jgi:hypothetical protein
MAGTFRVDDSGTRALLRHYGQDKLDRIFQSSARAGAKAAEPILQRAAPRGRSRKRSQFYRREGLQHGAFAATVKARRIRKKGIQKRTIGFVVGPAGRNAFTRHWIGGGVRPHLIRRGRGGRIQHPGHTADRWVEQAAPAALAAANRASEAVIVRYLSKIPPR